MKTSISLLAVAAASLSISHAAVCNPGQNDTIDGMGGDDEIYGGDGNDLLIGGTENDKLYGQCGDDTLVGGADDDELYGGEGNDTYVAGWGVDLIVEMGGASDFNVLEFDPAVNLGSISLNILGLDLSITTNVGSILIKNQFAGTGEGLDEALLDGGVIDLRALNSVPVPGAALLMATGIAALSRMRRKKS